MTLPRIKSLPDEAFYIPYFITRDEEERLLHKVGNSCYSEGYIFSPTLFFSIFVAHLTDVIVFKT